MKSLKITDEEIIKLLKKEFRSKKTNLIVISIMLFVFSTIVTLLFIKIGDRYNNKFLMGVLAAIIIIRTIKFFMKQTLARCNEKIINLILQSEAVDLEKGVEDERY